MGGLFVVFPAHRALKLLAKSAKLGRNTSLRMLPAQRLTLMLYLAMNVLQQGHQLLLEDIVIVWASQPTGRTEVFERDATLRALDAVKGFQIATFARDLDRLGFR